MLMGRRSNVMDMTAVNNFGMDTNSSRGRSPMAEALTLIVLTSFNGPACSRSNLFLTAMNWLNEQPLPKTAMMTLRSLWMNLKTCQQRG